MVVHNRAWRFLIRLLLVLCTLTWRVLAASAFIDLPSLVLELPVMLEAGWGYAVHGRRRAPSPVTAIGPDPQGPVLRNSPYVVTAARCRRGRGAESSPG